MPMTRSEIELIIKAKNEAQAAFDGLTKQIKGVTGESDKATEALGKTERKTRDSGVAATTAGVAFGLLSERMVRGLIGALGDSLKAANALDGGLIGLSAQATAFNQNAGLAQDAAKKLADDGLMSVGNAATGLKNLLGAGFGLDEAITLMNRFKDSAAFGRQGSLEFGQAIVGATEGIKNGNSALVDNAGLTKNLSNILVEAGHSAQDLSKVSSDLNIRQALFAGILKETNPQLGNTALFLETAAGKQAQFNSQVDIAQQQIGKALQPAVLGLLSALTPLVQAIGANANVLVPLAAALGAVAAPMAAMRAASALGIPPLKDLTAGYNTLVSALKNTSVFGQVATEIGKVKLASEAAQLSLPGFQRGAKAAAGAADDVGKAAAKAAGREGLEGLVGAAAGAGGAAAATSGKFGAFFGQFGGWIANIGKMVFSLAALKAGAVIAIGAVVGGAIGTAINNWNEWGKSLEGVTGHVVRLGGLLPFMVDGIAGWGEKIGRLTLTEEANKIQTEYVIKANERLKQVFGDAAPVVTNFDNALKALNATQLQAPKLPIPEVWKPEPLNEIVAAYDRADKAAAASKQRLHEWNTEIQQIASTGGLPTLRAELDRGVLSVKELAAEFGVSEGTIEHYKKGLKDKAEASKEAEKRTKELQKAQEEARKELEAAGIVTLPVVNEKLKELAKLTATAQKENVPLTNVVRALWPEYQKLADQAKASGVGLEAVNAAMNKQLEAAGLLLPITRDFRGILMTLPTVKVDQETQNLIRTTKDQIAYQDKLNAAYEAFGLKTPGALQEAALAAQRNFLILQQSGTATTAQLKTAYAEMIEAQREATGKLPTFWEKEFGPRVKNVLTNLGQDFSGTLAAMITTETGWKDGALHILDSFKKGATDILQSLLNHWINSFLKGMTNALLGESSGWGQIISDSLSRGGAGGGGGGGGWQGALVDWGLGAMGIGGVGTVAGTTSLAGVSGTASVATGISGGTFAGLGTSGAGAAAGGAGAGGAGAGAGAGSGGTFGGLSTAGLAGGALAGGAGLGLGLLGTKIFGGSGWKASGFGAGTGAATGALIGSVVPGIGTAAGAIVGGLAGAIGGWIGKSVGEKINDARDEFFEQFGEGGFGENSAFHNLAGDLHKVAGGDEQFKKLIQADSWDELNAAVKKIVDTLQGAEFVTVKVREGFEALGRERQQLIDQGKTEEEIIEHQAGSYSLLFDAIKKSGAEIPDAMIPIFQSMVDLGLLVDENGTKVTSLADIAFVRLQGAAGKFGTDSAAAFAEVSRQIDEMVAKGLLSAEQADEMRAKFKGIEDGAAAVEDTANEVEELTNKAIVARDRANELRLKLLEQENAHTTIEGSENRIHDLTEALRDAELQAEEFEAALRRAASVPAPAAPDWSGVPAPPIEGAAAGGVMATRPGLVIFGEGHQPEVGGPKQFFEDVFRSLGIEGGNGGGIGAAPQINVNITMPVMAGTDRVELRRWLEREAIPVLVQTLAGGYGRAPLRTALGVS